MNRKIHITVTVLFLVLLFGFGIAFWIIPDTDFSPEENRALQTSAPITGWTARSPLSSSPTTRISSPSATASWGFTP